MANCRRKMSEHKNFLDGNLFHHLLWAVMSSCVFKIGLPPGWSFNEKGGSREYGRLSSFSPSATSSSCSGRLQGQLSYRQPTNQPPAPMKSWNPAAQFGCSCPKPDRWQPRLNLLLWEWFDSQTGLLNFIWRPRRKSQDPGEKDLIHINLS